MRVSAIQWSKLFIVVLPTHKYMYTSSTTTLQLCLLGPLGMHYQFSHFNNRGQWYSKVTNKIFTVLSSAVTNSGAVIKSGRQLIQSLRQVVPHFFLMCCDALSLPKFRYFRMQTGKYWSINLTFYRHFTMTMTFSKKGN